MRRPAFRSIPVLLAAGALACAAEPVITISSSRGSEDFTVACDELQAGGPMPRELPAGIAGLGTDGRVALVAVDSLVSLDAVAESIASAGATVEAVLYPCGARRSPHDRAVLTRRISVGLRQGADLVALASRHGCHLVQRPAPDAAMLEPDASSLLAAVRIAGELAADPAVRFAEPEVKRLLATRYTPADPLFASPPFPAPFPYGVPDAGQWHLKVAPFGMQVEPVWGSDPATKDGFTGRGILVAMLDTGVEINHPDLQPAPNGPIRTDLSWNFLTSSGDVNPPDLNGKPTNENHGTVVAGLIAAKEGNGQGGVGVAFDAGLVPLRFITAREPNSSPLSTNLASGGQMPPFGIDTWPGKSDAEFRDAIVYQLDPRLSGATIHVSNNSWGNAGLNALDAPGDTAVNAMASATITGRNGRGLVLVWSAGNDHVVSGAYGTDFLPEDNAAYDGWLTRFTIPVGALNRAGRKTSFSEIGPDLLICAPGGEFDFNPYSAPVGSPVQLAHGLVGTDRMRRVTPLGPTFVDPGYNPGEQDQDGDDANPDGTIRVGSVPDLPTEDLNGNGVWDDGNYTLPSVEGVANPPYEPASTSFAAANLSGVVALMLQARPQLTWRDVQGILAHRARKPGRNGGEGLPYPAGSTGYPSVPAFILPGPLAGQAPPLPPRYDILRGLAYDLFVRNAAGLAYNHCYGYGAVNAMTAVFGTDIGNAGSGGFPGFPVSSASAVANPGALYWPLLPVEEVPVTVAFTAAPTATWPETGLIPRSGISDPGDGIPPRYERDFPVTARSDFMAESVELHVSIDNVRRSNLTIALASPSGTVAQVPWRRYQNGAATEPAANSLDYTFTFRNFLGENPNDLPVGSAIAHWRLIIVDSADGGGGFLGKLNAATLTIHGHRPYPVPAAPSADPKGLPTGSAGAIAITCPGSVRTNASGEVTVTKAYWYDNDLDTSAQVEDPDPAVNAADDLAAPVRVVELTTHLKSNSLMNVDVPVGLMPPSRSPGDAVMIVANPALPIGQGAIQTQAGAIVPAEDRYQQDDWEPFTAINLTAVGTQPLAIQRRVKRCPAGSEILFRYSRPPSITQVPDLLLKAGAANGTPVVVTFTVDDPDISSPNTGPPGFSRTSTDERLAVTRSIFNQAVVPEGTSSVALITPGPNGQGTGVYQFTGTIRGTSGISLVAIDATDGVSTTRMAFRVGVLTNAVASGCGGGMGIALLGVPLALWTIGRRRRSRGCR